MVFSTKTLVNVSLLENHEATFKLNSNIQGFANKVRQSYRGELILSKNVITNQIAQTADVYKVMYTRVG